MSRDTRSTTPTSGPAPLPSPTDPLADPLAAALAVTDELAAVLRRHEITLPSLTVDLASCTVITAPRQLVELGRVNMATARRLIAVLRTAQDPERDEK